MIQQIQSQHCSNITLFVQQPKILKGMVESKKAKYYGSSESVVHETAGMSKRPLIVRSSTNVGGAYAIASS